MKFFMAFMVLAVLCSYAPAEEAYAAEGRELSPLIQATTLEEDYRALTGLGLAFTPLLEEEDADRAFGNILCSCVRVQAEGVHGSGSIYKMLENEIIIVSNRHVLQYWNEDSYVTFFNGGAASGVLLGLSDEADVGFISVSADNFTYEELLTFRNIRMSRGEAEDEAFFCVDMASEWNHPVMYTGEIISTPVYLEEFKREMLCGKGEAVPGMSGSGIFDACGRYLGMLTAGTLEGEIAALPAEAVRSAYEDMT